MPPTAEPQERPKPSRIVINLDRARQAAHVPARGSRGSKILGVIALVLLGLIVGLAVGGYFWWQSYKTKPAYSLALLVDAVQRNDTAAFDQIVDTDKIVDNFVPQVTEKAFGRYSSALTAPLRGQIESLIPTLLPGVKQKVHEEVVAQVKELSAKAEGKPFVLVALGLPYAVDIKQENDSAKVGVTLKDRPVTLAMQRNGERWKIVSITDDTLAARIVDSIAKDLPAVGSQLEKEVRKNLKKNLPAGLPNVPLLNDGNK
ncbi:MAG: DUF2939 domain-containing protein [Acidobacteria bacterium]|nr:DUF2939 domain-containing protein [Acidobacteriota bacterium]